MPASTRLTDPMYGAPDVLAVYGDAATVQRMLDVEAALARAEAACGVIPAGAAAPIEAACHVAEIDLDALAAAAPAGGNLAIPLVKQLTAAVARRDAQAARYVHWGATSQDVIDTGAVLQLRDALACIDAQLHAAAVACAALARIHRDTLMVGRTWLQHALPITFGLKAAGWLDALRRDRERLARAAAQAAVLQFGGAAGTLASLGERAADVAAALAHELDLELPALPWHTQPDRLAEAGAAMGIATGTLGKIARDVALCMQTEIGELAEPEAHGRGGSSTMPHKRNPVGSAAIATAALRMPGLMATLHAGLVQEHERALGGWQSEWDTMPQIAALCAGAAHNARLLLQGLQVRPERMRANLDATRGLILGEAAMLALGGRMGRLQAHELVEAASRHATEHGLSLPQALRVVLDRDPDTAGLLDDAEIARLADPARYTGQAGAFVDRVLAQWDAAEQAATRALPGLADK